MTTISSLPRVTSLSNQSLFLVTENGVSKVVPWSYIRSTSVGYIGSRGSTGFQGSLGFVGSRGAGFAGSQGPIGPRGPSGGYSGSSGLGFSGSAGSGFTGSIGSTGSIGYTGSDGYVGSTGNLGFTGSIGAGFAGSQGIPGIPGGYTGSGGEVGFIGSQGAPGSPGGFTGSGGQGGLGFTGSTGAGFTGSSAQGFAGSRGFSGSVGPKGESSFTYSATAPTSPAVGDRWLDSNSGRELVYFNDGDTSQWIEVAAGRLGFIGSRGEPGSPGGYSGSRGATGFGGLGFTGSGGGFTGSSGAFAALGYTGSVGATGGLGFSGSSGAGFTGSGGQGFTGSGGQGFTGSIGFVGSRGFVGSSGSGFVGSQGSSGSLGFSGSSGAGFAGSRGDIGSLGYVGSRGTQGFIGSRGVDGYFGSIGTLGYTGSGGIPGINGIGFAGSQGPSGVSWTYNVKNYGATGNGSAIVADMTAETIAIQSAITAAQASGGTVFFPAGVYRINSSLSIVTNDQDPAARPHLLGEGAGGSVIIQTAAANGITVTGAATVPGTYVTIQGLTLVGNQAGAGLSFTDSAFAHVSDVHITNWAIGIYGIDVLSMTFEKVIIRFNTNGFRFERSSTGTFRSNPNAITMIGCVTGNNTAYGGWVIGAGTFNYIGGSIESNASGTLESASNWGLRITDPGGDVVSESSVGFSLQGVYFEANGGRSNFWIEATEANTGVVGAITGCSFNRISTSYATNHIRCEASAGAYGFPIALVGCGFRGLDGYTPSVTRPNIFNGSNYFAINPISSKASSTVDAYVVPVPLATNSIGTPGMITSDNSYMYICAADGRWYRYALATF